jgi:ubiquitin-like domain-containing CTD phosphatase 1
MIGTPEDSIFLYPSKLADLPEIIDDFEDIVYENGSLLSSPDVMAKLVAYSQRLEINMIAPFRPGKKLLVLDLDYTLFDHKSTASNISELMRPGMHDFLVLFSVERILTVLEDCCLRTLRYRHLVSVIMETFGNETHSNLA